MVLKKSEGLPSKCGKQANISSNWYIKSEYLRRLASSVLFAIVELFSSNDSKSKIIGIQKHYFEKSITLILLYFSKSKNKIIFL